MSRALATAAASCALALAAVLLLAAPASAADVDPAPIAAITSIDPGDINGLAVAPDGTTYISQWFPAPYTIGIVVFAPGATGDASPERTINGALTTLSDPAGLAIDASGNLWVADFDTGLLEFAAGASGNVAPIRTIAGGNTGLDAASDVEIGPDGAIYVVNEGFNNRSVEIFAATANGNAAPVRSIAGSNTGLSSSNLTGPTGVALQSDGSIVVSVTFPDSIETFSATASGNVAPVSTITGGSTELAFPASVAVDHLGTIYAADYSSNSLTEYPQNADGDVAPTIRIIGPTSTLEDAWAVAIDNADNLFVADQISAVDEFAANFALAGVSPSTGNQNGGTTTTIHGYGFAPGATVTLGGIAATNVNVTSSTTITAVVPAHALGKVDVAVTQGGVTLTAADAFTYTVALATTGVDPTPATGAGVALLLVGGALLFVRRRMTRSARRVVSHRVVMESSFQKEDTTLKDVHQF